jgi:ribosomal protein S18 acetylase RimI-like enzyme
MIDQDSRMTRPLEIRRLNTCTFDEALQIWNSGFEGYFVDMTLSLDLYIARLDNENLSAEHSLVAFSEGKPAGFLLNGIRTNEGRRVAWNGGTGVSPEFRGQGVGRVLVTAALKLYAEQEVEVATLEALSTNDTAISLYQRCGYEIIDRLVLLEHRGPLIKGFSKPADPGSYAVRLVPPALVAGLRFYQASVPWQAQWQSVSLSYGWGLLVSDARGEDVGYALYKKTFEPAGRAFATTLYQCVAAPGRNDAESILACALQEVYAPLDAECRRLAHNLSKKNESLCRLLEDAGFITFAEQVHMAQTIVT